MVIKNYKYDYSGGKIYYTIDVDGREFAMEHIKTSYGSAQNDIDDFLVSVKEYNFQEAEMLGEFVDFQRNLLMYGIDFELRNEVTR
jgi:gp25|nr:MAG TPA: hypothetical protein [Caudoviricetes sp.]DAX82831.1 MAG TPA: hypothetical protein [Caudoviricetes sp.]